ncbi:MAG: hypothetical protein LBR59_02095 [Endomicrobium sp.]|nr:hypothetical protein [Endomicrobium sp.]
MSTHILIKISKLFEISRYVNKNLNFTPNNFEHYIGKNIFTALKRSMIHVSKLLKEIWRLFNDKYIKAILLF